MTARAQEWLPDEALVDHRLKLVADETLLRWSERWLGQASGYTHSKFKLIKPAVAAPISVAEWRQSSAGMDCNWSETLGTRLGLAIVDAKDRKSQLSASDKALLVELAWDALSDLADMIRKGLHIGPMAVADSQSSLGLIEWQVRHTEKHLPDLALRLSASAFVAARKAIIGTKIFERETSGPLSLACADAKVKVKAILGDARISWGELKTLEPGDVVVLDQLMADSFPLLSAKSGAEVCRLSLLQAKDGLRLVTAQS